MTPLEIILIITGLIVVAISFLASEKLENKFKKSMDEPTKDEVLMTHTKSITDDSIKTIRNRMNEVFSEMVDDSVEKTDSELSTICNEKIMALTEYSDQILSKIDTNHKEVMFLYNMLNEKENELKETIIKIDNAKQKVKDIVDNIDNTVVQKVKKIEEMNIEENINKKEELKLQKVNRQLKLTKIPERKVFEKSGLSEDISNDTIKEFKEIRSDRRTKYSLENNEMVGNNNEMILRLYEEGKSTIEIAKMLGLGQGEVKLVIGLFRGVKK